MNRRRARDRSTGHTARVSGPSGDRAGMTRQPRPRWADDIDDNDRAAPTDAAAGGREKLATIANFHHYESRRRSRNCEQIAISHQRGHRLYPSPTDAHRGRRQAAGKEITDRRDHRAGPNAWRLASLGVTPQTAPVVCPRESALSVPARRHPIAVAGGQRGLSEGRNRALRVGCGGAREWLAWICRESCTGVARIAPL